MFWFVILALAVSVALPKLGAASVMVNVLSIAVTGSMVVIAALLVRSVLQWRRSRRH